jgi:hypothetical protein
LSASQDGRLFPGPCGLLRLLLLDNLAFFAPELVHTALALHCVPESGRLCCWEHNTLCQLSALSPGVKVVVTCLKVSFQEPSSELGRCCSRKSNIGASAVSDFVCAMHAVPFSATRRRLRPSITGPLLPSLKLLVHVLKVVVTCAGVRRE